MDHALMPELATAGYKALRDSAAWLDLSRRGRLRITGEDRARLLNAMTTNQVQALQPGQGCYLFFLNAQGRILGDANLFCFEDHLLLDTEPETRQKLFEHLDRYIIADDVTVEDVTDSTAAIGIEGPLAETVVARLDMGVPEAAFSCTSRGAWTVAKVSTTGSEGFCVFLPAEEKGSLLAKLAGVQEATPEDARTVRIEHGRPRYGEEIAERYLVQETGQLQAVNFNKGCYLGQEIVERVRSRAQIHRLLQRLEIDTSEAPAVGVKLTSAEANGTESSAAEIASAVYSPALGKVVAMAYVRVPFAEPGTKLAWGNVAARVSPASS